MPRKYSHINKLAQGLVVGEGFNENNSLSTQKDMNSLFNKKGLQNQAIAADLKAQRHFTYNNHNQLKTTNAKHAKRRNSKRLYENLSAGNEKVKNNNEIKNHNSQ